MPKFRERHVSITRIAIALIALTFSAGAFCEQLLFVANSFSGTVSQIAIPEHHVVETLDVGVYLSDVSTSVDGRRLYVTRIDEIERALEPNMGESGELIAYRTDTLAEVWRTQLDGMPQRMAVDLGNRLVYVPYYDSWWVAVVDTELRRVATKLWVGNGPFQARIAPKSGRLYVGSMMNDVLVIIGTEKFETIKRIELSAGLQDFAVTGDESVVYGQLERLHGFVLIDPAKAAVTREVLLPPLPDTIQIPDVFPHTTSLGIELTPDQSLLFANGTLAGYVAVYRVPELELMKTIDVGREPCDIAFDLTGRFAYICNRESNDVSVIDVEKLEEIARIPVGKYPERLAIVAMPARAIAGRNDDNPFSIRETVARQVD